MQTIFTETIEQAFAQVGIEAPAINGAKMTRFSTNGKKGDTAGWLRVFDDNTGAAFGDWRSGDSWVWQRRLDGVEYSSSDLALIKAMAEEHRKAAEAQRDAEYAEASSRAEEIVKNSIPAESHPYLEKKKVGANGALLYRDSLLIPVVGENGIQSVQTIMPSGEKRFMSGGKMSGGMFNIGKETSTIIVCEGFATGASIHEATGMMVVVAFSASNLVNVSTIVRKRHAGARIIVAGDDDPVGRKYAEEAATAVCGSAVFPADVNSKTDFNDLACNEGVNAVCKLILGDRSFGSYDYSTSVIRPIEFCVDGFLANKVTVIAGAPGVGKTSLLVPLSCVSAGVIKGDVTSALRRRVCYVTEDPEQVERILFGLRKQGHITCSDEELRYWFDIIPAVRASSDKVAQFVRNVREDRAVVAPKSQNFYVVEPLIVLDTSNATINMDNENDNSEAGKAIASIKENLGRACLWIVAHTAKVASRAEVEQMSARGAGAFEGDANAVAYIINVENIRFMVLGKRRFEADFTEVRFESGAHYEVVRTPWGTDQHIWYRYGVPVVAADGERESLKSVAKEKHYVEVRDSLRGKILAALLEAGKDSNGLNTRQLRGIVGGNSTILQETLEAMLSNGVIRCDVGEKRAVIYRLS